MSTLTNQYDYVTSIDPATGNLYYNTSSDSYQNGGTITTTTTSIGTSIGSSYGTYYDPSNWITYQQPTITINPLKDLNYSVEFDHIINRFDLLEDNIRSVKKNKFIFNCQYEKNRIQPYELIMDLINKKTIFSVKIKVSDILTIVYSNLQFIKIENNFTFDNIGKCDFSELIVKIKYEKILYENHKLSEKELRAEKLKKISESYENSNS